MARITRPTQLRQGRRLHHPRRLHQRLQPTAECESAEARDDGSIYQPSVASWGRRRAGDSIFSLQLRAVVKTPVAPCRQLRAVVEPSTAPRWSLAPRRWDI
ncbi:phosphate import ATP-binding protein pstB [Striga asiatica]|uniref:Phosphate import ATP-binding protein pstB n=1 Tax=Striga asiatica TaxID=4170 RepID=A0A5A7NWZ0_STRAF|nr:phosphate import ATP-binding protein pstB [Striga asiatica]